MPQWCKYAVWSFFIFFFLEEAHAVPVFARQYQMSCTACHAAFPRLNDFGLTFQEFGNRLETMPVDSYLNTGDPDLVLPSQAPLALRVQSFLQARDSDDAAHFDFQTPYLVKLISGAPIGAEMSYYLYGVFAERGENGRVVLDDAWIRHGNLFNSGVSVQVGQFQISELMFPRELRTTFQDFLVYRMADITYQRGVQLGRSIVTGLDATVGFINGNGTDGSFAINRPGLSRPDRSFDNDSKKSVFGRLSYTVQRVGTLGLFGLTGRQASRSGLGGDETGLRSTPKSVWGLDMSGEVKTKLYWFAQILRNRWEGILDVQPTRTFVWWGGFAGVDHVASDRWLFSGLMNWTDSGDFAGTGTVFEGLESRVLTLGASYYVTRNLKVLMEGGLDFLSANRDRDNVGHETRESYILLGFDTAI